MSALQNPSSDSPEGQIDARQPQVKNVNFIPTLLKSANHIQMASTGKRSLETKVISMPCKRFHFFEHQPPRAKRRGFRRKGRQSLRDQVRIYKIWAIRVLRQEFPRKCSLACAVRSRDDVDIWAHENPEAYIQLPRFARQVRLLIPNESWSRTRWHPGGSLHTLCHRYPRHRSQIFALSRLQFAQMPSYPSASKPLSSN
jgi:hypothetical protein